MKKNRFVQTSGRKTKLIICITLAVLCVLCVLFAVLLRKKEGPVTASALEEFLITPCEVDFDEGEDTYYTNIELNSSGMPAYFFVSFDVPQQFVPRWVSLRVSVVRNYSTDGFWYILAFNNNVKLDSDNFIEIFSDSNFLVTANDSVEFFIYFQYPRSVNKLDLVFAYDITSFVSNELLIPTFFQNAWSYYDDLNVERSFDDGVDEGYIIGHEDGYNEGYTAGEAAGTETGHEEGYNEGLTDGRNESQRGIFNGATFDFEVYKDNVHLTQFDKQGIVPEFVNTGVTFNSVGTYYQSIAGQIGIPPFPTAKITLNVTPFLYKSSIFKFYSVSESGGVVSDITVMTQNGTAYTLKSTVPVSPGTASSEGIFYELYLNNTQIDTLSSPIVSFTWDLYLYYPYLSGNTFSFATMDNNGYIPGYNNGYNDGYEEGQQKGFTQGKTQGFNQGKEEGYNIGFSAGAESAKEYTFLNLISAVVDAPIKSFTGLLNFEILGFNISALVLSLLSVALLLKIISVITKGH